MEYYYLIVFEDGSIKQIREITEDDKESCELGYCDIIRCETQPEGYDPESQKFLYFAE